MVVMLKKNKLLCCVATKCVQKILTIIKYIAIASYMYILPGMYKNMITMHIRIIIIIIGFSVQQNS